VKDKEGRRGEGRERERRRNGREGRGRARTGKEYVPHLFNPTLTTDSTVQVSSV